MKEIYQNKLYNYMKKILYYTQNGIHNYLTFYRIIELI
jgi:hypothetical protein